MNSWLNWKPMKNSNSSKLCKCINPGRGAGEILCPAQFLFYGGNAYDEMSHLG